MRKKTRQAKAVRMDAPAPGYVEGFGDELSVFEAPEKTYLPRPEPLENDERQELQASEMREGDEPAGELDFTPRSTGWARLD